MHLFSQFILKYFKANYILYSFQSIQKFNSLFHLQKHAFRYFKKTLKQSGQDTFMFIRRQLKQGNLFRLDTKSNEEKQQLSSNQLQKQGLQEQISPTQNNLKNPSPNCTEFDVQKIASQNNIAIVLCGAFMCFLCTVIASGLFYFFLYDYVKEYIQLFSPTYLTQTNAKQYFAKNQMIAGQIHYPRVPQQYWAHRIQMIKSMGMNALSVYVFWNYHEIQKGKFDFQTKNKNLTHFLELCKQYQMDVLLRPGPYVCAEWDWGGLPLRLMTVEGLQIRSSNELFISQTRTYFQQLTKVIKNYIRNASNPEGPILMIQVQNEPGWYTQQKLYIQKLKSIWEEIDIGCPLYFDDTKLNLQNYTIYWQNAIIGLNPIVYDSNDYETLINAGHFVFGGQIYSGWFTSWGGWETWEKQVLDLYSKEFKKQFSQMLSQKRSFSMYLVHGGTNFGLSAGFNLITSYDYNAPINQQGLPTINYYIFRSLFMDHTKELPQKIPAPIQTMNVTLGELMPQSSLFENLPTPIVSAKDQKILIFESKQLQMFNQGIVMYETAFRGPKQYNFELIIHDIGFFFVDGQYDQTVVRSQKKKKIDQEIQNITISCKKKSCRLQIIVEAMGHVNFGKQMNIDQKGIIKLVDSNTKKSFDFKWKHYKFDISKQINWKNNKKCSKAPCLYSVEANLTQNKDTYINVKDLRKGYIWVNGYNLGRYWDVGPQNDLYCPGAWLNKGMNKILVLDMFQYNFELTLKGQSTRTPITVTDPVILKRGQRQNKNKMR